MAQCAQQGLGEGDNKKNKNLRLKQAKNHPKKTDIYLKDLYLPFKKAKQKSMSMLGEE